MCDQIGDGINLLSEGMDPGSRLRAQHPALRSVWHWHLPSKLCTLLSSLSCSFSLYAHLYVVVLFCFVIIGKFLLFLVRSHCTKKHVITSGYLFTILPAVPSCTIKMCYKDFTSDWPTQDFGCKFGTSRILLETIDLTFLFVSGVQLTIINSDFFF